MQTIEILEPVHGWKSGPLQKHHLPEHLPDPPEGDAVSNFQWNNLEVVAADRSMPLPIHLKWSRVGGRWSGISYEVCLSPASDLTEDAVRITGISKPCVEFWHPYLGTTYHWKVQAFRKGQVVAESAVASFATDPSPPRWIRVPGITNVRDLGGWPLPGGLRIRQGMVFRSSEMNGHLNLTSRGRHILEEELGIRTDLDLRGVYDGASSVLDPQKVNWINAPISPYDCISDAAFREEYLKIFHVFAAPENYPVLFHCVGGADRGGTVAFLLNGLLGKDREHLIRDFELTTLSVWGERSRWSDQFRALLDALRPFSDDENDVNTQIENYARSIGVTEKNIASIRDILVEKQLKPAGDLTG